MADLLEQYRKEPLKREASAAPVDQIQYVAFAGKDNVSRLRIRRANNPTRSPVYHHLIDISYDGDYGTNFVLNYHFMTVLVRGRNLQTVVLALETGTADFIQEYDPDRWPKPKDESAPFIASIQIVMADEGPPAANEKAKTEKTH